MALRVDAYLGLNGTAFHQGLNRANASVARFSSGLTSGIGARLAGLFSVGAMTMLVRNTVQWASKLNDVSTALGVNVEWLQKMQNGAKQVKGDIEDIERLISDVNKSRQEAINDPKGKSAGAFARLGISSGDIANAPVQKFIDKLVAAFKDGSTANMQNDLREVGGKSARTLLAAFETQFASGAPILAEDMVNELDDIGDKFTTLGQTLMVTMAPAILAVGNAIVWFVNQMKQAGATLGGFSAGMGLKDIVNLAANPIAFLLGGKGKEAIKNAQDSAVEEATRQQESADNIELAAKRAKEARAKRNAQSPGFDVGAAPGLTSGKKSIYSDSLLAVGNFLGAGRGAVQSVAEKQLQKQTQILAAINITNTFLAKIPLLGGQTVFPANP
jgi:hypothetical protein